MQSIKEHEMKANHNNVEFGHIDKQLYAIYQRTRNESKSQLVEEVPALLELYAIYQRTRNESKSQLFRPA
ncbi:MAG TPA: hypothetical protein PKC24_03640 [Cyclobacteriaceae bacterium]|nr:hypothetical protein [Cyclobacteriaceae bacterium]